MTFERQRRTLQHIFFNPLFVLYTCEIHFQLQSQLNVVRARHQAEIADLHKQIAENKTRSRDNENMLRSEIESLKGIINKLEARLGKFCC